MNRILVPMGTAFALMIGLVAGCSESNPVDNTSTLTDNSNSYIAYKIDEQKLIDRPLPTFEQVVSPGFLAKEVLPTPTLVQGDFFLNSVAFGSVLTQIPLTPEQKMNIELCFKGQGSCAIDNSQTYAQMRQQFQMSFRDNTLQLRSEIEAGTISMDEARIKFEGYASAYHMQIYNLDLKFKTQMIDCTSNLDACIISNLTPEQLLLWTQIRATMPPQP